MTTTCCSTPLRSIEIETPSGILSMGYCQKCDDRRWFLGDREVKIRDLLARAAAEEWTVGRNWKKPRRLHAVA